MQPTRNPPQNKRPTETKSGGLEANIPYKWTGKMIWNSNIYIRQNRLENRCQKIDSKGHFIILKGRTHREDINIVNIYAPNIGATTYIRMILQDIKDIHSNTLILGDFNTPLSKMDRYSKQNINTDIAACNNVLDQMDYIKWIYIHTKAFIPKK